MLKERCLVNLSKPQTLGGKGCWFTRETGVVDVIWNKCLTFCHGNFLFSFRPWFSSHWGTLAGCRGFILRSAFDSAYQALSEYHASKRLNRLASENTELAFSVFTGACVLVSLLVLNKLTSTIFLFKSKYWATIIHTSTRNKILNTVVYSCFIVACYVLWMPLLYLQKIQKTYRMPQNDKLMLHQM